MAVPVPAQRRRATPWTWIVTGCAVLVVACGLALAIWWLVSRERTITSYAVQGAVNAVQLDVGSGDAVIVGGAGRSTIDVRRSDEFAFGQRATSERSARDGTLAIRSRCPRAVLGACQASYRLTVPDNIPITVRTSSGNVRFSGYRGTAQIDTGSGDIDVQSFCGFGLRARAQSGNVGAVAACAPERLELRSRTGDVHAVVPPGRYQLDAETDDGRRRVTGITAADDAPFQLQALSTSGDVTVEAGE
jgi:hypothetical protein